MGRVLDRRKTRDGVLNRRQARRVFVRRLERVNTRMEEVAEDPERRGQMSYLTDERDAIKYALYLIDRDLDEYDEAPRALELPEE